MAVGTNLVVAPARTDEDLLGMIDVRRRVNPEARPTLAGLRHHLETEHGLLYVVARVDGEPVGCGFADGDGVDGHVSAVAEVVPERRRRGIGSALHRTLSDHARAFGNVGFLIEAREDDPDSQAWLERRGYVEVERQKALVLDLGTLDPVVPDPPAGIRIVTRAERTDVVEGMYEVGREAGGDIPGLDGERVTSFEQWRAHEVDRPSRVPEFTFVALEGDEVVGYAALDVFAPDGYNGLTGVRRAWRGRGIARALKRSQIVAAKAAGLERLITESAEGNIPMRRLNESLGYRPKPGTIVYKGPLT